MIEPKDSKKECARVKLPRNQAHTVSNGVPLCLQCCQLCLNIYRTICDVFNNSSHFTHCTQARHKRVNYIQHKQTDEMRRATCSNSHRNRTEKKQTRTGLRQDSDLNFWAQIVVEIEIVMLGANPLLVIFVEIPTPLPHRPMVAP
jgi:hypothetical protein